MRDNNLIDLLPFDIVQQVSSFLDYKSIASASKVSKTWHGLFNNNPVWKYRFIKDFDIDAKLLATTFPTDIKNNTLNYKQHYSRFYYLSQQRHLPKFIKNIYLDKTQHHLVFLASADNLTCLEEMTREQQYIIAILGAYTGCFNIPCSFIEKHKDKKLLKDFLHHAIRSGNLELVKYLLNPDNQFGLEPDYWILKSAAQSGNFQLVEYLLNARKNVELVYDRFTLMNAANSGNLQLVKYLLNLKNKCQLKPDYWTLNNAANSGNLQLVQYLLDPENKFGLEPDKDTLKDAAKSGNLQLVQYLLNPKNKFGLTPDDLTLNAAAGSHNLQVVQYLLNSENKFGLEPDKDTLKDAAQSGNLKIVQYLLNPENKFGLTPDHNTLDLAASSGNLQLVQYLLNPENQFGLIPDKDIPNKAARCGNFQLVQYLLNRLGLKPGKLTLNCAAISGNLQFVQYLLNPENKFDLEANSSTLDNAVYSNNFALSKYLLPSHLAFQDALQKVQDGDLDAAKVPLKKSQKKCPSHYNMMLQYILNNPQRFHLNDESIQCLKEITKKRFVEDSETSNPKRSSLSFN